MKKHYFSPREEDRNYCRHCDEYLTAEAHIRIESAAAMNEQAKYDAHSCVANAEYTHYGPTGPGSYCTECGALVRSDDADSHQRDHDEI
jgi:hypothetical protein